MNPSHILSKTSHNNSFYPENFQPEFWFHKFELIFSSGITLLFIFFTNRYRIFTILIRWMAWFYWNCTGNHRNFDFLPFFTSFFRMFIVLKWTFCSEVLMNSRLRDVQNHGNSSWQSFRWGLTGKRSAVRTCQDSQKRKSASDLVFEAFFYGVKFHCDL